MEFLYLLETVDIRHWIPTCSLKLKMKVHSVSYLIILVGLFRSSSEFQGTSNFPSTQNSLENEGEYKQTLCIVYLLWLLKVIQITDFEKVKSAHSEAMTFDRCHKWI